MNYTIMEQVRWWLPIASAFALVVKGYLAAKKSISEGMHQLLNNHLDHIQTATMDTHAATLETNKLLSEHNEKEMKVWEGVVNQLTRLDERTRPRRTPRPRRRK